MVILLCVLIACAPVFAQKCTTKRDFSPRAASTLFYDYVIVGGGTAGAVVAARLAEDKSVKVLLLEQGPDMQDSTEASKIHSDLFDLPFCDVNYNPAPPGPCPAASTPLHVTDTPLMCAWASHTDAAQQFYVFPQTHASKKEMQYPRGGVLGGSSTVNYLISIRGVPSDFDNLWTVQEGLQNWTYNDVLPYYRKMETVYDVPADKYHGTSGPVCITKPSRFWPAPMYDAIETAAVGLGIPKTTDFNNPASTYGIGQQTYSACPNGRRSSSRSYITRMQALGQVCFGDSSTCAASTNLHILTKSTVVKILFDSATPPRAIGVQYVSSVTHPSQARTHHPTLPFSAREGAKFRSDFSVFTCSLPSPLGVWNSLNDTFQLTDRTKWHIRPEPADLLSVARTVETRREVILAAGNFVTPQLLMLSGVGPRRHLESLGITVVADLKGVGQGVEDHDEYFMTFKHNDPTNVYWNVSDVLTHIGNWYTGAASPVSSNHAPGSMDISINGTTPETHSTFIQFYYEDLDQSRWRNKQYDLGTPKSVADIFSWKGLEYSGWLIATGHKCAKGWVKLRNRDPLQAPLVDLNLGGCKKALDEMIFATKTIRQIMSKLSGKYAVTEMFPGPTVTDDEDLRHVIRTSLWGHQTCCSSPMGPCASPQSVLDDEGRVFLVSGLRVVDVSSFPTIPVGNTWLQAVMVAEKLADAIKQQYSWLNGHLFADLDGDGVQSVLEPNVPNAVVTIVGTSNTTVTNSLGEWRLDVTGVTGDITLSFNVPSSFQPMPPVKLSHPQPANVRFVVTPGAVNRVPAVALRSTATDSQALTGGQIAGIVLGTIFGVGMEEKHLSAIAANSGFCAALIAILVVLLIFVIKNKGMCFLPVVLSLR